MPRQVGPGTGRSAAGDSIRRLPDILIRGGLVFDGADNPGIKADVLVRDGVIAKIASSISEKSGARHRCRWSGGGAGLHRHQDPFRFHAADQSEGREQAAAGRHHRDHRPLRLLGRAGAARQGRLAARLSQSVGAMAAVPRAELSGLSRYVPGDRAQSRHAGRAQYVAADGHGHGPARADHGRTRGDDRAAGRRAEGRRARPVVGPVHLARLVCGAGRDDRAVQRGEALQWRILHPYPR